MLILKTLCHHEIVQTQRTVDSVVGPSRVKCVENQGRMQVSGWRVDSQGVGVVT